MANTPRKDGTLFKKASSTEVSYDARLIFALENVEKPTSYELEKALGWSRKGIMNRIKSLQLPFPDGFSMKITSSSTDGYTIVDYGVFTKKEIRKK